MYIRDISVWVNCGKKQFLWEGHASKLHSTVVIDNDLLLMRLRTQIRSVVMKILQSTVVIDNDFINEATHSDSVRGH